MACIVLNVHFEINYMYKRNHQYVKKHTFSHDNQCHSNDCGYQYFLLLPGLSL